MPYKVILDPGHGGSDPGAVYQGRNEKDDVLNLAQAVGQILEDNGYNVVFTRTTDVFDTPFEKAVIGNNSGADLFVSLHRDASPEPNTMDGVESLVFSDDGIRAEAARNINAELESAGFVNRGVKASPSLIVLKRTKMPAVLVEVGYLNSEEDNRIFDANFDMVARAIADGIMETLRNEEPEEEQKLYRVQVGAYRVSGLANQLLNQLLSEGFPAFITYQDGLYRVQVGAFALLDNAVRMEQTLRNWGYNTFITT
nr:N-acetylmuramoyl-L-alanine amidase [Lachnotalea sp. AF33-28]